MKRARVLITLVVSMTVAIAVVVLGAAPPRETPIRRQAGAVLTADVTPAAGFAVSQRVLDLPAATPDDGTAAATVAHGARPHRDQTAVGTNVADTASVIQPPVALPGVSVPSLAFDGLNSQDGQNAFGGRSSPPDVTGDVGPSHYVQAVNLLARVYSKTGAALTAPFKMSRLFAPVGGLCATNDNGSPTVLYDPLADRWLLGQVAFDVTALSPPYHQCLAVSTTGDPTGTYFLYDFISPGNNFNDTPRFGAWPDGYYMTGNQYLNGVTPNGAGVFAFDRAKMLAGDPTAVAISFSLPADFFGMLPADVDGRTAPPPGAPNYVAMFQPRSSGAATDAMRLFAFHADFANPGASSFSELPESPVAVAAFDPRSPDTPNVIEQPAPSSTANYLDAPQDRLMHRLAYRNFDGSRESLVVTHTVNVGPDPSTPAGHQAAVRYYELRRLPGGAFTVPEQATFAPDSDNRWMGSAAMDSQGNLAVAYNVSGLTTFPSIRYAGRLASDPPNGLAQGEATLVAGSGAQLDSSGRWGAHSALSVDPVDDCTFWYTGEYYTAASQASSPLGWLTRIGSFKFQNCGAASPEGTIAGQVTNATTGGPIAGAVVSFTPGGFVAVTNGGGSYQAIVPVGVYSLTVSAENHAYQTVFGVAVTAGSRMTVNFVVPVPPGVGTLTGKVRNSATGAAVANAVVSVQPGGTATTTDATGSYVLSLPVGTYTVNASATLYTSASVPGVVVSNQAVTGRNLSLSLPSSNGVLTGHVRDAVTNAPIANALVTLSPGGASVTTDGAGLYALLVPPATYTATVSATGYGTASSAGIRIDSQVTTTRDFLLAAGVNVDELHEFVGLTEGAYPNGSLIQATDGDFYGTLDAGGHSDLGTVFKMTATGIVTVLHEFSGGADGAYPVGALIQATDGNFYGTTYQGGVSDSGTVFKMTPAGAVTVLHAFTGLNDGAYPYASLIQATDGNFYGTTSSGGATDQGTVFKITPGGVVTILHAFTGSTDGAYPYAGLIQATDGNFYGTTGNGGSADQGTVFRMTPAGVVTVLHVFTGSDGAYPGAALIEANDGNFYATAYGGDLGQGTVFKMTPSGAFTLLHSFRGGADGADPGGPLIQATDGNFYGTTADGGLNNNGTIFRMTPAGTVTVLYGFTADVGEYFPYGALTQGTDGSFYGTTIYGGIEDVGTAFRLTVAASGSGTLTGHVGNAATNAPIANAAVSVSPGGYATTADATGLYSLSLPPGPYTISASAAQYLTASASGVVVSSQATTTQDFSLVSSPSIGILTGHVLDTTTSAPIQNAVVTVTPGGNSTTTDGAGLYAFSLPVGTYDVTASAAGHTTASSSGVDVANQVTTVRDFSLPLSANGVVEVVHSFSGGTGGSYPHGPLVRAADGNIYGTTNAGGAWNAGTVFKLSPSGAVTVLHTFTGTDDGAAPNALIQAADGDLYGTTFYDSSSVGSPFAGTVFKITTTGTYTRLHTFTGPDGLVPGAALVQAADGDFYGTTSGGGGSGTGTVFKITPAGTLTTLHVFNEATEGFRPLAALLQASDGNFYGSTLQGAASGVGAIFKMTPTGSVEILHAFSGGTDGAYPSEALVQGTDGDLYGTIWRGGGADLGHVFRMTPAGVVTILHSFTGAADGAIPDAALIQGSDGDFYGTTSRGGSSDRGTAFRMTSAGVVTVLHAFTGGPDGGAPSGTLIQVNDGNFYGTTGWPGSGSVFMMTPAGTVTILYSFNEAREGFHPYAALLQGKDGYLYSTTGDGGTSGMGTVFKMTAAGDVGVLHSFVGGADGFFPTAGLIQAADGYSYGTTWNGGVSDQGTVFKMTPSGTVTILHAFAGGADGAGPSARLIEASDGNFYGVTVSGGAADLGTIFRMTPGGTITVLHAFTGGADGAHPGGEALVQATDGNFYGTTYDGGASNTGTIFEMTPTGDFTILHAFGDTEAYPNGLIQAADGSFYGTTFDDVYSYDGGSIFRMSPDGAVTILHSFGFTSEGTNPAAGLVQGTDGDLYGTTLYGPGFSGGGTIFRMTPAGSVTTLHTFTGGDGAYPYAVLIQAADGHVYGTTGYGGTFGLGTVFRLTTSTTATGLALNASAQPTAQHNSVSQRGGLTEVSSGTLTPDKRSTDSVAPRSSLTSRRPSVLLRPSTQTVIAGQPVPFTVAAPGASLLGQAVIDRQTGQTAANRAEASRAGATLPIADGRSLDTPSTQRAPVASPPREARMGKWEVGAFGGGMFFSQPTGGTGALPAAGTTFTTTAGQPSRRVSSWYFGDGARLLNTVNTVLIVSQKITPLDAVLTASAARRRSGGGVGVRVSRVLTPRTTLDMTVESSATRVDLSSAALQGIEAARASFASAWNGLASAGQFDDTAVTSVSTVQVSKGRQTVATGAFNVALKQAGKAIPYVTMGAGFVSNSRSAVSAGLVGDYRFVVGGVTPVHETDAVMVRYTSVGRGVVVVLGGGVKYALSRRFGVRLDWRTLLGPNRLSTTVDSSPTVFTLTPSGSGASFTNPGLQFSNDPSIGIRSNLNGPGVTGFRTFTGLGVQRQTSVTLGLFWRF